MTETSGGKEACGVLMLKLDVTGRVLVVIVVKAVLFSFQGTGRTVAERF